MTRTRTRLVIGATALALVGGTATGVVAATRSSDETALTPVTTQSPGKSRRVEYRIQRLIDEMTLPEKLQQLQLLSDGQVTDADARNGVGGVFSLTDPQRINELQRIAVEESRLGIPILFAYDTIHGYRTIFPIPLGAASSFDPAVAAADHRVGARESAAVGIKQIYGPMVDVSHDPRWGRIAEGAGEDPYLNAVMAAARVKAAQGRRYDRPRKVVTSVKHYAAYGQPEGGRDYNTTDMSLQRLHNLYLPPFRAAIDAGAGTVMCSFNAVNGVPGCANRDLETRLLKHAWNFDGFIESDYTAVAELRACPARVPDEGPCGHGVAADGPDAAAKALNAGTDMEMVSTYLRDYGEQLQRDGYISMRRIDDAVARILRIKFRAGLFRDPYADPARAEAAMLRPGAVAAARTAAGRSMVLLKNADGLLPLDPAKSTAVIGPFADNRTDMLGPWWGRGEDDDVVTVVDGIRAQGGDVTYAPACTAEATEPPDAGPGDVCGSAEGFDQAVQVAQGADQVVLALGETKLQSGEAAVRSELDLPGLQQDLIERIKATGKPFVVVLFNGRPLTLERVDRDATAILEAWFPGVQAGNAVADVLFGEVNPGGKLPVTFPRRVGQVPLYYNHEPTGRPCDVTQKYVSRYRDIASCAPLYPFGYGLSYTTFAVSDLRLDTDSVTRRGSLTATVNVTNTGDVAGDEVVQLYLHDPVASISQPVRRLRGFERVTLAPGQTTAVTFTITPDDYGFFNNRGRFVVEPGRIHLYAGTSSQADLMRSFTIRP